jgi:hypothetical protein
MRKSESANVCVCTFAQAGIQTHDAVRDVRAEIVRTFDSYVVKGTLMSM